MIEVDVKIAIVASKTAGRAEGAPAGRLVSGSFIPLRIDEALGHQPGVPVGGEPVVGQAPGSTGEQGAGEIRIEGAFGPDQKTTILCDQAQPGGALALGPAQPATPRPQAQRRTRPARTGRATARRHRPPRSGASRPRGWRCAECAPRTAFDQTGDVRRAGSGAVRGRAARAKPMRDRSRSCALRNPTQSDT